MVGRGQEADVQLKDLWVSHFHCILNEIEGTLVVRDLGAKNGMFVNGLRTSDSFLLPGDRLTLGCTTITVQYHRRPKASTLPAFGDPAKMRGNGERAVL
jgi:pSer/pThr/pTyr-binding forkhead associated (FHA) protein